MMLTEPSIMVVDSSAILAILFGEPEGDRYLDALCSGERLFMSALNRLEIAIVVEARKGAAGAESLRKLMAHAEIEVLPLDASQAEIALYAWRTYGKGRHPASLNLGDCAAYALAKTLNQCLLYKGDDFARTDVIPWEKNQ
jgi:ribonuclease VapC